MLDQSKLYKFRRLECAMGFLRQDERDVVEVPLVVGDLIAAQIDDEPSHGRCPAKGEQHATDRQQISGTSVAEARREPRERRRHQPPLVQCLCSARKA